MELKMSGSMSVLQYASKFTELSRFVPEFVSSERLKMRRFEEGLAFYIRNQLAGQPILTYQELYERAAEVERIKTEFRALNSISQKRKGIERGAPSESVNQKKPTPAPPKSHPTRSAEPCTKCGRTNNTTPECRVGTNKCMLCGSPEHLIAACPRRLKAIDKSTGKPLASLRQGTPPSRPAVAGRAFVRTKRKLLPLVW